MPLIHQIHRSSIFLFFLLFSVRANATDDESAVASSPSLTPSGFWLSTELLSVTFHKGCLSTALCHQPAFKLVHTMTLNGQKSAMSWPVDGGGAEMLQDRQLRQFVSHWTVGDPEDVSVACQIAGIDPSFGFARVCDETSARRVFQEAMVRRTVMHNNNANIASIVRAKRRDGAAALSPRPPSAPSPPSLTADNGQHFAQQMVVEMRGRCFNATLAVRAHLSRCPWCPDPNVHIHVDGTEGGTQQGADGRGNDAQQQQQLNSADSLLLLHNIVILALSGAVVFAFTGLCAVFVAQRRHRQNKKQQNKKTGGGRRESGGGKGAGGVSSTLSMMRGGRHERGKKRARKLLSPPRAQQPMPIPQQDGESSSEQQQTMIVYGGASRRIAGGEEHEEEESRYDTPWDNKYCLVPRQWLFDGNGSACGVAPPAPLQAADAAWKFRHPPTPLQRPSPYDHSSFPCDTSSGKYATCANLGSAVAAAQTKSPMMGMMCSQRTAAAHSQQSQFYGTMPTADQQKHSIGGRAAAITADQSSSFGARATMVPNQPPPPPPIALLSVRHAQPKHGEKTTTTFTSPNTSSSSDSTRHDDSGLDSV
ncbi:hypothetical protein niasHS_007167 [Heterodera schachtii]|uniref:C2 domain-containing protein n=1 Tax=Heterodera schachtii TaxID=97005 RepID=A0ABD2JLL6_HETSC